MMMPEGHRPLNYPEGRGTAGGVLLCRHGSHRGVGGFIVINQFDFGAAGAMASALNDLIAALAPR